MKKNNKKLRCRGANKTGQFVRAKPDTPECEQNRTIMLHKFKENIKKEYAHVNENDSLRPIPRRASKTGQNASHKKDWLKNLKTITQQIPKAGGGLKRIATSWFCE